MKNFYRILLILALALVVLALAAIFTGCAKKPGKTLTVDVTHGDGTTKTFTVKTDAENLGHSSRSLRNIIPQHSRPGRRSWTGTRS